MTDGMVQLLFWNINKQRPEQTIARLIAKYQTDILLLAESGFEANESDLLSVLNVTAKDKPFSVIASSPDYNELKGQGMP